MGVFCQRCGTGLPPSARFCSNCGAVVPVAPFAPGRPLVRIFTVIGFFFSGGLVAVAYLACWVGIPEESMPLP